MADPSLEQMIAAYASQVLAAKTPGKDDYWHTPDLMGKPFVITAITDREKPRTKTAQREWLLTVNLGGTEKFYTLGCNEWRDIFMQGVAQAMLKRKSRVTVAWGNAPGSTKSSIQIVPA